MYKYYFRRCETGFHKWCQRIYYCKELISDYYHFSDDMKEHYKEKYRLSLIIVNDYKKLNESLNNFQKEILNKYYINGKLPPWETSSEDRKTIYNNWEEIVFPNGVSRIKTVEIMSVAKTIKKLRKNAGYNREEVAGLLNISVATLRKYEDGKSLVRLDILMSMLQIYGHEIDVFFSCLETNYIKYMVYAS